MGKYFSLEIIKKKEKEQFDDFEKANMMLQIADKEMKIQQIQMENATIMMELAMIKGGL